MTPSEFEQASQAGQIEQVSQEVQSQDTPLITNQVEMTAYTPLLASLLSPRKFLSAAPTFTPKNFLEQIQIVDDGTDFYLYIYFTESGWQYRKLSGSSDVTQLIAGSNISLSPSNGKGNVTISVSSSVKLKVVASPVTIQNTTTELDIFSFTLPANTLSTNNAVRAKILAGMETTILFNNGSDSFTLQAYYGSSSFSIPVAITGVGSSSFRLQIDFSLIANGATNSQKAIMFTHLIEGGLFANNIRQSFLNIVEVFTEDSTVDKTLKVTGKWSAASNNNRVVVDSSIVDLVE